MDEQGHEPRATVAEAVRRRSVRSLVGTVGRRALTPVLALASRHLVAVVVGLVVVAGVRHAVPALCGDDGEWTWTFRSTLPSRRITFDATSRLGDAVLAIVLGLVATLVGAALIRTALGLKAGDDWFGNARKRYLRAALNGTTLVIVGTLLQVAEDVLAFVIVDGHHTSGWLFPAVWAAAWGRAFALGLGGASLALLGLALAVRTSDLGRREETGADEADVADVAEADEAEADEADEADVAMVRSEAPWPPTPRGESRRGVCLSGGGIRSASFSLGALQALRTSSMGHVDHLTSVSGGGYLAAAWASMSEGRDAPPFAPGSAEERWVRHHTNYLVSSVGVVFGALGTLLVGFAINVVLVLAVLAALAHPLGWTLGLVHPELRANTPIVEVTRQPELALCAVDAVVGDDERPVFEVRFRDATHEAAPCAAAAVVGYAASTSDLVSRRPVAPRPVPPPEVEPHIVVGSALVVVGPDGWEVGRHPVASIDGDDVEVSRQPRLDIGDLPDATEVGAVPPMAADDVERLLSIDQQPELDDVTGTDGRRDLAFPDRMQYLSAGLLILLLLMWVGVPGILGWAWGERRPARVSRHEPVKAMGSLLALVVVVLYVAPWAVAELPGWVADRTGAGATVGWQPWGTVLVALGGLLVRARGVISGAVSKVGAFRGKAYLVDGAVGLVFLAALVTAFVSQVDLSSANGPHGLIAGTADGAFGGPDWVRWAVVTGVLVVALALGPFDAHAWSLHVFYRGRINQAYLVEPDPTSAGGPTPAVTPRRWLKGPDTRQFATFPDPILVGARPTEWTVCTTLNMRGSGEAAPGRSASSFTISKEWVGGPAVGWMRTDEYVKRLSEGRARDVDVPSMVAISGAAFSPAMGKESRDWTGRVFALANLRLGVWVANPHLVGRRAKREARCDGYGWLRGPNPAWYLRELVGWYDRSAPYLYLSDGGHWDNLGLVELFRRGCTDIWVVSAAGDGPDSFETFAQALALAREEAKVEVEIELEPLRARPPAGDEGPTAPGSRRLLQKGSDTPTSPALFVPGRFWYLDEEGRRRRKGTITVIEATIPEGLPWDVHAYAEANSDFPDISTGYQMMDHRDFEAYRMLGHTQMRAALQARGVAGRRHA